MALPRLITTLVQPDMGRPGPYAHGGNYYFAKWDRTNNRISILKATGSPDSTWSEVANSGTTVVNLQEITCSHIDNELHFLCRLNLTGNLGTDWITFDMSTDSFGSKENIVSTAAGTTHLGHVEKQSGGNVVASAQVAQRKIMGTDYDRKAVFVRTAANTWNRLDYPSEATDAFDYEGVTFGVDTNTDKIHFCMTVPTAPALRACTFAASSPWAASTPVTESVSVELDIWSAPSWTISSSKVCLYCSSLSSFYQYFRATVWDLSGGDISAYNTASTTDRTGSAGYALAHIATSDLYDGINYTVKKYEYSGDYLILHKQTTPNYWFEDHQNPLPTTNIHTTIDMASGSVFVSGSNWVFGYTYLNTSLEVMYDEYVFGPAGTPEATLSGEATMAAVGTGGQSPPAANLAGVATITADGTNTPSPFVIVSGSSTSWAMGDNAPVMSWGGHYYILVLETNDIKLYKSDNPYSLYSGFTAVKTIACGNPAWSMWYDRFSNCLHVAIQNGSSAGSYTQGQLVYCEITLDQDNYRVSPTVLSTPSTPSTYRIPSMVVHPKLSKTVDFGHSVIIAYQGSMQNVGGTDYDRINMAYMKRDGTWVVDVSVDPGGSDHWMDVKAIPANLDSGSSIIRLDVVFGFRSTTATNALGGTALWVNSATYDEATDAFTVQTGDVNDLGNATNQWTLAPIGSGSNNDMHSYCQNYQGRGIFPRDGSGNYSYFSFSTYSPGSIPYKGSTTQGAKWFVIPSLRTTYMRELGELKRYTIAFADNTTNQFKRPEVDSNVSTVPPAIPSGTYSCFGVSEIWDQSYWGRHSYLYGFCIGSNTYIYEETHWLREGNHANDPRADMFTTGNFIAGEYGNLNQEECQMIAGGRANGVATAASTMEGSASITAKEASVIGYDKFELGEGEAIGGYTGNGGITWTKVGSSAGDARVHDRYISVRKGA